MRLLLLLSVIPLFLSCASSYKGEIPMADVKPETGSGVELKLDYNIPQITGCKKFNKRINSSNYTIAKVKITNNGYSPLVVGRSLTFQTLNNNHVPLASGSAVYETIRQRSGLHFLYMLLFWAKFEKTENGRVVSSVPFGYVLAPALSLGNFGVAQSANTRLQRELVEQDLNGKTVNPGEEISGFLCFSRKNIGALKPVVQ